MKPILIAVNDAVLNELEGLEWFNAMTHDERDALLSDAAHAALSVVEKAAEISTCRMAEPLRWAWMTEAEAAQMLDSLEAAIRILTDAGQVGIAEQIGDVRDVFNRSGIHA